MAQAGGDQGRGPGTAFIAVVHAPLWARSWAFIAYGVIAGILGVGLQLSRQASLRRRAGVIGLSASVLRTGFIITFSLLPVGAPRRNEADQFVGAFFSHGVRYQKEHHSTGKPYRLPARLSPFTDAVLLE